MFVLCGTDLQQEVLVFVSVEHQVGKLNFLGLKLLRED